MKSLLLLSRRPPWGSSLGRDGLDAALAGAALGLEVALLFLGDGVYQLLKHQQPPQSGPAGSARILPALPMYGIHTLYVDGASLKERALGPEDLALEAQVLELSQTRACLERYDGILAL